MLRVHLIDRPQLTTADGSTVKVGWVDCPEDRLELGKLVNLYGDDPNVALMQIPMTNIAAIEAVDEEAK